MHITVERPINTTIFPVDEQVASFRYFFFFLQPVDFYTRGAGFGHSRELSLQGKAANQSAENRNVSKKLMKKVYYLMAKETTLCFCFKLLNKEAS